ncbi:MAG: BTAD domain-containing putative transcriptional regulator [Caldilineaceae bacterium]
MNNELLLNLLGNPVVTLGGNTVTGFQSSKVQALLYYLAVAQRPQSRSVLANLLWGDVAEAHARRSLTAALSNLRRLLGDYFATTHDLVEFRRDLPSRLDVARLETALAAQDVEALRQVVDLYQGEFLEGFYVRDTPEFELWVARERARLREQFMIGLGALADHDARMGKRPQAIAWTRRMLQIEPWREEAHRNLIRYLGEDGQRGAALAQFETCRKVLAEELGVEPEAATLTLVEQVRTGSVRRAGRQNSDAPVVGDEAQPAHQPAARQSPRPPHNLLLQLTPFVGRQRDVEAMIQQIGDPACRLLTLVGPGGIGKTRLALHVAEAMLQPTATDAAFKDGIYFVPLSAATDRTELIAAIAEAIGVSYQGTESPAQQLVAQLAAKQMLLILDNFEHLIEEAPFIADLLRRAPTLTLLVTSREALNVQGVWVYSLQGLACPPRPEPSPMLAAGTDTISTEQTAAEQYDAVQFFAHCAQRARIGFALDDALDAVIRICQLVDGLPLALELAASWLRVMPIAEIVAEIENGLDILVSRRDDIAARHRSMRVVLDHSWQMLAAQEQAIFKRLSVFRGGFQRAAAKAVAEASLMDLAIFVEKSLLQMTPRGRYQIHELLRQFAAEQLAATPTEATATANHHSHYYLDYLAARTERLVSSEQPQALDEVGEEIENVRAAWLWAGEQQMMERMTRATDSLYHFYWVRRRGQEGKEVFARTLAHLPTTDLTAPAAQLRMNLLRKQGLFYYFLGDYTEAYQHLAESMVLARRLEQPHELAYALNITGTIAGWQGNVRQALLQLNEALAISQSLQDERAIADTLQQLAQFTAQLGDYAKAHKLVDESIQIARTLNRPDLLAHALHIQGSLCFYRGNYEEAERIHQETHALFTALEHNSGIALALSGLSSVAWARGGAALATAEALCVQSLTISRTLGSRLRVARQLVNLAYICCDRGDFAQALACAKESLTLADALQSKIYQIYALYCLGNVAGAGHDFATGKAQLVQAITIAADAELLPLLLLGQVEYATLLATEAATFAPTAAAAMRAEALTLFTVAEAQPACWHLFKVRAEQRRLAVAATLADPIVAAAIRRAQTLSPVAIAHEIRQRANLSQGIT